MANPILIATTNPTKQACMQWLIADFALTPVSLADASIQITPNENGTTHEENAALKALFYSNEFNGLVLASDGGLVIQALGNRWNSVHTARFAGPNADEKQKARKLLALMQKHSGADRRAHWVEALALAEKGQLLKSWTRKSREGLIRESYEPTYRLPGFWVFSLWYFPEFLKGYLQLTPEELALIDDHWTGLRRDVQAFLGNRETP